MKVLLLDSSLEPLFWEYVNRDIPDFYFFILDIKRDRPSTEMLLALNHQDRIEGMLLEYKQRIAQLRGSIKAARVLLDHLDIEKVEEIQALDEHKPLILSRFRKPSRTFELVLMTLRRGEEDLHIKHPVVRLSAGDAEEIAALMREGTPEFWGETTSQRIAERMKERLWLGIRVDGKLVSAGGATIDDWGSNITTVVTHLNHRNRGYATSVVSTLVKQILEKSNLALIHVVSGNEPAMKVYAKVGFKPYKKYFVARAIKS